MSIDEADRIPAGKEALDIAAAAARLRLPVATVERALERGFISGIRDRDGNWRVLLDKPQAFPAAVDQPADGPPSAAEPEVAEPEPPEVAETSPQTEAAAPAPAPSAAEVTQLSALVGHLLDEVRYLREEVTRRDVEAGDKDETIIKLMERFAAMNKAIVERLPSADAIYMQIEQAMRHQRETSERHDRELHSIKDVLGSVRGYLSKTGTTRRK